MKCIPLIKQYRESRGIKQKWLAEQIGVSPDHLRKWEKGDNYPNACYVLRMCKVLGCRVEDLFKEED